MDSLPLGSPLDTLQVSSNFGSRKNKLTQKWEYHSGTDFIAYKGTTQLQGVTGTTCTAGQFCITTFADTNWTTPDITPVVVNTKNLQVGDHDGMTAATADCTYTILLDNSATFTKKQSFTKSQAANDGADGVAGLNSATVSLYRKNTSSSSATAAYSGTFTYTFAFTSASTSTSPFRD